MYGCLHVEYGDCFRLVMVCEMYGREDHRLPTGYRPNAILTVVPLASLIIVAGLRYKVGTDYHTYMLLYELAGNTTAFGRYSVSEQASRRRTRDLPHSYGF
ncbi:hypothetical protein PO124_11430 [Bacillus licheniformis]|nr:hypothetical protein [Bacillus licheniformis]